MRRGGSRQIRQPDLVEGQAQREDIARGVPFRALQELRSHVARVALPAILPLAHLRGSAEVADFDHSIVTYEEVGRLYIQVHQAATVNVPQPAGHVVYHVPQSAVRESLLR